MTEATWAIKISQISSSLADRKAIGNEIVNNPEAIMHCLSIISKHPSEDLTTKSAFALDQSLRTNIELLKPYSELFFKVLNEIKGDTEKRIFAKILELISEVYLKNSFPLKNSEQQIIITTCFDWLINEEKVAVKVFAMQCLFNFKNAQPWIAEELIAQLEMQYPNSSAGFKSRANHILNKLKN